MKRQKEIWYLFSLSLFICMCQSLSLSHGATESFSQACSCQQLSLCLSMAAQQYTPPSPPITLSKTNSVLQLNLYWYVKPGMQFKLFIFTSTCSYSVKTHSIFTFDTVKWLSVALEVQLSVVRVTAGAVDNSWSTAACALLYRAGTTDWLMHTGRKIKAGLEGWRLQICDLSISLEALH